VSPYFAPGERCARHLMELARSGVRVRVLTGSLASAEAAVVHSGYSKRRCELARAGVRLYEMKPSIAGEHAKGKAGMSSAASLHAKTFAADGERIFVGSFNFDLRSALLNTEMGLVISSPALAGRLGTVFDDFVPANAYEVRAKASGACVEWIERTASGDVSHETEPLSGWGRRAWLGFLELLPVDWLL
jgi:putative cardiolipin synthase